eukprot:SAG31_NODE_966_length_10688_cov_8.343564_10_plen_33_part_00
MTRNYPKDAATCTAIEVGLAGRYILVLTLWHA